MWTGGDTGDDIPMPAQVLGGAVHNDIDTQLIPNPMLIPTNPNAGVPATTITQGQVDIYPSNE